MLTCIYSIIARLCCVPFFPAPRISFSTESHAPFRHATRSVKIIMQPSLYVQTNQSSGAAMPDTGNFISISSFLLLHYQRFLFSFTVGLSGLTPFSNATGHLLLGCSRSSAHNNVVRRISPAFACTWRNLEKVSINRIKDSGRVSEWHRLVEPPAFLVSCLLGKIGEKRKGKKKRKEKRKKKP